MKVSIVMYGDSHFNIDEQLVDIFSTEEKAIAFAMSEAKEQLENSFDEDEEITRRDDKYGPCVAIVDVDQRMLGRSDVIVWWIIREREVK